jgi:hypothetical protein
MCKGPEAEKRSSACLGKARPMYLQLSHRGTERRCGWLHGYAQNSGFCSTYARRPPVRTEQCPNLQCLCFSQLDLVERKDGQRGRERNTAKVKTEQCYVIQARDEGGFYCTHWTALRRSTVIPASLALNITLWSQPTLRARETCASANWWLTGKFLTWSQVWLVPSWGLLPWSQITSWHNTGWFHVPFSTNDFTLINNSDQKEIRENSLSFSLSLSLSLSLLLANLLLHFQILEF